MIGEKINNFREKNNLSQTELGKRLHVTRACVSQWELNKRTPSFNDCIKIAEALNISLYDLVDDGKQQDTINSQPTTQQKNCIDMIMQLDEELLSKAEIYLTGLSARTETFVLKKMK